MLRLGSVVINVADVRRAAAFWCAALGYEPLREPEDDWVLLAPPGGAGPRIGINLSDQQPPEIPHVHLDLYAGDAADQAAEIERLIGLGAERVDWPFYPDESHDYVVLADPDGNRFCVIDTVTPLG
jgi:catechol 2,3-dioxygenase-like lactoylglutathione lyase family enzyme